MVCVYTIKIHWDVFLCLVSPAALAIHNVLYGTVAGFPAVLHFVEDTDSWENVCRLCGFSWKTPAPDLGKKYVKLNCIQFQMAIWSHKPKLFTTFIVVVPKQWVVASWRVGNSTRGTSESSQKAHLFYIGLEP